MSNSVWGGNSIYFTKDHDMVRRAVADFVNKEINPHVDQWEEDGFVPLKPLFQKMGELGFLGIRYDSAYGGEGLDYWYDTVFLPVVQIIREKDILRDFPHRTETDLYVWIAKHQAELAQEHGEEIRHEAAAADLVEKFSPRLKRVFARAIERMRSAVLGKPEPPQTQLTPMPRSPEKTVAEPPA